jgi:hypothetical protein
MEIVDVLLAKGEHRVALDVCGAVGVRRVDALTKFLAFASPDQIRSYAASDGVFSEADIADALFSGEDGLTRLITAGISNRAVFHSVAVLGKDRTVGIANLLGDFLSGWNPVDLDVREVVADFYCELLVKLDAVGMAHIADGIRGELGKCFLDQRWTDDWDVI